MSDEDWPRATPWWTWAEKNGDSPEKMVIYVFGWRENKATIYKSSQNKCFMVVKVKPYGQNEDYNNKIVPQARVRC